MSNTQTIASLYRAFAERDFPTIIKIVDPQFTVQQTGSLPWGGTFNGLDGLKAFFGGLLRHIDSRVEVSEYMEAGDDVVAIGRTRGTVNANGQPFDFPVVHVWTFQGERVRKFQPFLDSRKMLEVLSLPPATQTKTS